VGSNQNNSNEELNDIPANEQNELLASTPQPSSLENTSANASGTTLQPQPPLMEVHSHTHTPGRKWTHYFWEFFMLFLAVFCGFLAENFREHYVERERATQYAGLLVADMEADIAFFNKENIRLLKLEPKFDSLINLLILPSIVSDSQILKKMLRINYVSDAKVNSATYNQMKASGSLRYINNLELTTGLQEYYEIDLPHAIKMSQSTLDLFNTYIKSFFIDHLRTQDMDADNDTMKNWNPIIIDRNRHIDQRLANIVDMAKVQLRLSRNFYEEANKKANELVLLIKKENHLK
jgi:hypothetical protein